MAVLFVGPLPPPVHGFAAINAAMLAQLQATAAKPVVVFNRAPPPGKTGLATRLASLGAWLRHVMRFAGALAKPGRHTVYLGFSGGAGQALDWPFLLLARCCGARVFLHHHSFAYLNQRSAQTAWVLATAGPRSRHIALCADMKSALVERYPKAVLPEHVTVLSNAAYMTASPDRLAREDNANDATVTVGFLSNITAEKGVFDFFEVLAACRAKGLPVRGLIAGPVAPDLHSRFNEALAAEPSAQYLGPLYGEQKTGFWQRIDLLLFPTRYVNEAEPVTIHEALQAGVQVLAATRGCIGGMVPKGCGKAVRIDGFAQTAVEQVKRLASANPEARSEQRSKVAKEHQALMKSASHVLSLLVKDITQ